MVQLDNPTLSLDSTNYLKTQQDLIDGAVEFPAKINRAKDLWNSRTNNRTFVEVKSRLTDMCCSGRRCCYCEDSAADEIEHIYPKNIYPGKTFVFDNYLYACGPCNGGKNNSFEIFENGSGNVIDVTPLHPKRRLENYVPEEPPAGEALLINPREEDPLNFMMLDLMGTFHFVPTKPEGQKVL